MALHECLVNIQSALKAPKNQTNTFGKYNYRSCEDILEAVKPLLKANALTLQLSDGLECVGDRVYIKATATLSDGTDSRVATAFAREPATKKGMDESQITGTASSYARKYALNGLFCIDDTKDADTDECARQTNAAKPDMQAKQADSTPTPENDIVREESVYVCADCSCEIGTVTKKSGDVMSAEEVAAQTNARYGRMLCPACWANEKVCVQASEVAS